MLFLRTFHVFLLTAAPLTVMKRMKNAEPGRYDLCLFAVVVTLSKQKKEQLHVHGRSSCRQSGSWATDE